MTILICFGTRPEYIKVKSLIDNLPNIKTCFTGQHNDLLQNIDVDYKLDINENISDNRLNNIFCNIMKYSYIFKDIEYVLVQGDTTSASAIAISAFNHGIKIIHLEAGLRSNDLKNPFPEEMNRQIISRIADIHLCPTEFNKQNLEKENVSGKICVVGNTGLDNIDKSGCEYSNQVLVTMHRRDNHEIMDKWFEEIEKIANKYPEIEFMIPLHPNPNVQKHRHIFNKVKVVEPMEHDEIIEYVKKCKFVISDSGGLQEECSFLNKKIIVCRKTTERPESVDIHSFMCEEPKKLEKIVNNVIENYEVNAECPYGDGKSCEKIINIFERNFKNNILYKFKNKNDEKIINLCKEIDCLNDELCKLEITINKCYNDNLNEQNYWNFFYKNNYNFEENPTSFFYFVIEYLKDYPDHKTIIDLGCGNGRDFIHFKKNNYIVTGIDSSKEICNFLKEKYNTNNIICDSFVNYGYKDYDIYYSRFSLHALVYIDVLRFVDNISKQMNEKSLLFIETRSIKGTEYEKFDYYESNFKSGVGDYHNRTLFKKDYLIKIFNEKDLFVEYEEENNGLSVYKDEDPFLIRLVLRKVNIEILLNNILTDEHYNKHYFLKNIVDDYIKIFDSNNVNYGIFFGNLIALLRHNELIIPWDDDIDIIINKEDVNLVIELLKKNYKHILIEVTNTSIIINHNNFWLDIFYDIEEVMKVYTENKINIDISKYQLINNYKIPCEYKKIFDIFYKNFENDFFENCLIYNHKIYNRWSTKNFCKIKVNIYKIKLILQKITAQKKNKIKNIISNIVFSSHLINDICILIIPNTQNVFRLLKTIKTLHIYNKIKIYIYVTPIIYNQLSEYLNFFKIHNIFLIYINESTHVNNRNVCDLILQLMEEILNYRKIILYNDYPIFVNEIYNLKITNSNIDNCESLHNEENNCWFNEKIKIEIIKNFDKIFFMNYNGIFLNTVDFIYIIKEINQYIKDNIYSFPYLEIYLPTFIKHKFQNIEINELDNTLWEKNFSIFNNNVISYTKKY
jgi:UDP-N-acetylglucosamine 2-epimerase (non-hydrolysing)